MQLAEYIVARVALGDCDMDVPEKTERKYFLSVNFAKENTVLHTREYRWIQKER